jgi:PAS domain S-box-containing protein
MAEPELDAIVRVQGAMYHALFDSAPLGYFVLDTRRKIHDINERGLDLLGTSREHALGESIEVFVEPLSRPVLQTHLDSLMELRTTQRYQLQLQGRDRGDRVVEVVSRLVPEQVNDAEYVFLTMTELTEQTEWSTRLADLGRFASWIAHELRQPLSSLKLAVYNISKKCREPDVGVHLRHADEQITVANQIITDLLAVTTVTAPRTEQIDLRRLIDGLYRRCAT